MKKFLCAAVMLGSMAFTATAAITVDLLPAGPGGVAVPIGGGIYRYDYDVDLSTNSSIDPGDFFVFYDFTGWAGALAIPDGVADWDVTSQSVGPNPAINVFPAVDTAVDNIVFTYTGVSQTNASGTLSLDLGTFQIFSTVGTPAPGGVGGQSSGASSPGTISQGLQTIDVPQAVPEPATMGMMGGALIGLGLWARRRK